MASFPWQLVTSGVTAVGQLQQGDSAAERAGETAGRFERNAELVRAQAIEDQRRFRIFARRHLGKGRAAIGASGVVGTGSAAEVMADTARNLEADAISIVHEAELQAQGFEQRADAARKSGKQARRDARYRAAGSLLTGIARYQSNQPTDTDPGGSLSLNRTSGYSAPDDGYRG